MNAIFGSGANGGHLHDGVDNDGHCGKVDIMNHTSGNLDISSRVEGYSEGQFSLAMTGVQGTPMSATALWRKTRDVVHLTLPHIYGISTSTTFSIPNALPDAIRCWDATGRHFCPAVLIYGTNGSDELVPGAITIYDKQLDFYIIANGQYSYTITNGNFKGIIQQTIKFRTVYTP
jgi:hypothetical protein